MSAVSIVIRGMCGLAGLFCRALKTIIIVILTVFLISLIVLLIGNLGFATKRDQAHRNLHPSAAECTSKDGWSILAEVQNDEFLAIERDPAWRRKFQCAIQVHNVPMEPNAEAKGAFLKYYLGFLEFKEDGTPQPLVGRPKDSRALSQYAVLQDHLRAPGRRSNFLIVFVHGWRHDARVGDGNVADLRHYAAHVARFLSGRCRDEQRFCGTEVTAIYVGWRGARVDENRIKKYLGETLGGMLATSTMWITLYDRKPISEEVGPAAVTALRGLDRILDSKKSNPLPADPSAPVASNEQRMIVIGHSLGGNMLMTALKEQLIKNVSRHEAGKAFGSPLGDLVVLVNAASEAANWTAIQRVVWHRIAFRPSEARSDSTLFDGHHLFDEQQPPVLISITAARSWPPSGIWTQDCEWLRLPADKPSEAQAKARILPLIANNRDTYATNVNYDWATYDLFPVFKFDFRPLASTVQRVADRIAARQSLETGTCPEVARAKPEEAVGYFWRAISKPVSLFASFLRNMPFMNTDREQTRTIGHLDPPRPSTDTLIERVTLPFKPFGTTHELVGNRDRNSELPIDYARIPRASEASCDSAPHWLWRARQAKQTQNGTFWDSNELMPLPDGRMAKPAAHIVHSFVNAGMAAITRANDPFWNIRAFDNALSEHGGYMLSSFICAVHQLVMDDAAIAPRGVISPR
jgi:hypothetical protein